MFCRDRFLTWYNCRRKQLKIVLFCLFWTWLCAHLRITPTPSLTQRVFWISDSREAISQVATGGFVRLRVALPPPKNREAYIIKRVGCSGGEKLQVDVNHDFYCNGAYIGRAKMTDQAGSETKPFVFNGVIPEGLLFLISDHPDGFDSRYFGFVPIERITDRVWAIF